MFNWRDKDNIQREHERRPGRATWPLSTPGPAPPPETHTSRFRQNNTPKEAQRDWEGKQKITTQETLLFFFFFFGKSCPNSFPKLQALGGGHHDDSDSHWPFTSAKALMIPLMAAPHNGPGTWAEQRLTPI